MAVGSYSPCTKSHFFHLNQHVWLPCATVLCQIPVIQSSLFNTYVCLPIRLKRCNPKNIGTPFAVSVHSRKKNAPFGFNLKAKTILVITLYSRHCLAGNRQDHICSSPRTGGTGSGADLLIPSTFAEIKLIWASDWQTKETLVAGELERQRKFWVILILVN